MLQCRISPENITQWEWCDILFTKGSWGICLQTDLTAKKQNKSFMPNHGGGGGKATTNATPGDAPSPGRKGLKTVGPVVAHLSSLLS